MKAFIIAVHFVGFMLAFDYALDRTVENQQTTTANYLELVK